MKYWFFLLVFIALFGNAFSTDFNGPIILTDFNFLENHYGEQEIDFYCWDNITNDTTCISETKYSLDEVEKSFVFGEKILFNFVGTKQITIFAQNNQGIKNTKNFTLTIQPIENKPQDEEEIQEGEKIIFEETPTIEQNQNPELTNQTQPTQNNNEIQENKNQLIEDNKTESNDKEIKNENEENENRINEEINKQGQENSEEISQNSLNLEKNDISSSNEKTPEPLNLTQKDKIYIILLTIILVLLIAIMYTNKNDKKEHKRVKK